MIEVQVGVDLAEVARPGGEARVRVGSFEGPLGLLLALIEARELDVLTVPLADLVEGFLGALARIDEERAASLAAFVAVAAQLILIKSRAMLPVPPQPAMAIADDGAILDPEEELRRRLITYRAFRDAGLALGIRAEELGGGSFHRESVVARASARVAATAVPVAALDPLDPVLLADAVAALARVAMPPVPPPDSLRRTIAVEERAALIREALRAAPVVVLQDLLRGVRDRVVAAVTFLAMLELVKQREIVVEQAEPWGDIVCRRA